MMEPGSEAPDFTLSDQDGNQVTLSELQGSPVVLVFYPLDFSPVCTDQLSVYQEVLPDFEERGAKVFGISVDHAFAHKAFQEKLGPRSRCWPTSSPRARSPAPTTCTSRTGTTTAVSS